MWFGCSYREQLATQRKLYFLCQNKWGWRYLFIHKKLKGNDNAIGMHRETCSYSSMTCCKPVEAFILVWCIIPYRVCFSCWYFGSYGFVYLSIVIFYLKFNCCAWVYILKFYHLKMSGAVDAIKWNAKWRTRNISDIFFFFGLNYSFLFLM